MLMVKSKSLFEWSEWTKSSETRESAFCDIKKIGGLFKVCLIVVP